MTSTRCGTAANDVRSDAILDHLLASGHERVFRCILRGDDALGNDTLGADRNRRLVTKPEGLAHARNLLVGERALRLLVSNSELFDLGEHVLDGNVPLFRELVDALLPDQPCTSENRARNDSRSGLGTTQRNERTNPPRRANVSTHVCVVVQIPTTPGEPSVAVDHQHARPRDHAHELGSRVARPTPQTGSDGLTSHRAQPFARSRRRRRRRQSQSRG